MSLVRNSSWNFKDIGNHKDQKDRVSGSRSSVFLWSPSCDNYNEEPRVPEIDRREKRGERPQNGNKMYTLLQKFDINSLLIRFNVDEVEQDTLLKVRIKLKK